MIPQKYDLKIYRGDTTVFNFIVTGIVFAGAVVKMDIKPAGTAPVLHLGIGSGLEIVGGQLQLTFSPEMTRDAAWSSAIYDIEVTAAGVVTTIVRGKITIINDVTK